MREYYSVCDIGLYREKNQDSLLTIENKTGDLLAIVCDGIGGGLAGDVASKEICDFFKESFSNNQGFASLSDAEDYLDKTIQDANTQLLNKSFSCKDYYGMGTTLVGVLCTQYGNLMMNSGDSRLYGFTNKLQQLSHDDTLVNQMYENGDITYEESLNHPKKHYLVKAMGVYEKAEFVVNRIESYDYYLICSDGLHGYVTDEQIEEIMANDANLEQKCEGLLSLALLEGGYDNITVVIVKNV